MRRLPSGGMVAGAESAAPLICSCSAREKETGLFSKLPILRDQLVPAASSSLTKHTLSQRHSHVGAPHPHRAVVFGF